MAHPVLRLACALLPLLPACGNSAARQVPPAPPIEHWRLPTGSRIAIARFAATAPVTGPPIVFLHGGPGAYQLSHLEQGSPWYRRLAAAGRDVYVYDQVGSGLSDRLSDPAAYSVARHVADLEAIRAHVGASRLALVGDSWGASLASAYTARHLQRVERLAFTSPGTMHAGAWNPHSPTPRVMPEVLGWAREHRTDVAYRRLFELDRLLRQQEVRRGYAFLGDAELDRLWDDFITDTILPTTVHDPGKIRQERMRGMGGWVMLMTHWDAVNRAPDPRPALRTFRGPVLVLRGDSDYLPAGIADEYARVFPQAKFVRLPRTGHLIWLEQPRTYARTLEEFLLGQAVTE